VTSHAQKPRAWLLTFKNATERVTDEDVWLDLPDPTLASFREIAGPDWLIPEIGNRHTVRRADSDGWEIVFLPAGSSTPYATQKSAEAWVGESRPGPDVGFSLIEIALQGVRILRAERRIVVIGSEDWSIRKGVAQFEWLNDQLRQLESRIFKRWKPIEDDVRSLYASHARPLSHPKVGEAATEATLARNWLVRAESVLDRPDLITPPLARRIFLELSLRSEMATRLRAAERAVENSVAFYEHAFSWVSERQYAHKSLVVEFGIFIAILLEIALQLWELLR